MRLRILLSTILLASGLLLFPSFVFAENDLSDGGVITAEQKAADLAKAKEEIDKINKEIAARKDKIKQMEEAMAKFQSSIDRKRTEAVSLKNQISILDNRAAQIEADIEMTKAKISEAELQIEALQISIKEKEAVMERQKKLISKMIQTINADDQKNYVEIMLTNKNFADFYGQLKYLESVYTDLGQSVKAMRELKDELSAKKTQVESKKKVYVDLSKELADKKYDLEEQTGIKQNLLAVTHSSELKFRTLLANEKQQYQAIENEMRSYEDQIRKKLAEQDKLSNLPVGNVVFAWPVPSHYITSVFHDSEYPYRNVFEHSGMDIRASHGTQVRAAASGYVARAKRCTVASCYAYVLIVHTGNLSTVYGHLSSISVSEDQFVNRGDVIGNSGGTRGTVGAGPFVTGPHLHFEARLNGIPTDPMKYLMN